MNYLFVLDNCKKYSGANTNIAINIARELKASGNSVFLIAYDWYDDNDQSKMDLFDKYDLVEVFFEQNSKTEVWIKKNKKQKVTYCLVHPVFLLRKILKRYRRKRNLQQSIKRFKENNQIDCILGFSSPFSISQIVAHIESRAPKIIIQLDPYTNNATLPDSLKSKRKKEEAEMLNKIDYIFVAAPHYLELVDTFPEYSYKMKPLELPVMVKNNSLEQASREKCNVVKFAFTGMFYKDIRNPEYMFNLFIELPDYYKLEIAGKGEEDLIEKYKSILGDKMEFHGILSSDAAQKLAFSCDFLINLNNSINNQLPSKLYEYIASGYPVINICKLRDCPSLNYTRRYSNCIDVFENDPVEKNVRKIIGFVKSNYGVRIPYSEIEMEFASNTIQYASRQIEMTVRESEIV